MRKGQLITGLVFIILGIGIFILSFFTSWSLIIYSALLFVLGGFILFNKGEDKIEERKDLNKNKQN